MAVFFQGKMTEREQADLTIAMVKSGEQIDSYQRLKESKWINIQPVVWGIQQHWNLDRWKQQSVYRLQKMSGRGLGHTGGTIDKLESIKRFHVELENEQFIQLVNQNKLAIISNTYANQETIQT